MTDIHFFQEEGGILPADHDASDLRKWIQNTIQEAGGMTGAINYIFCDDEYLLQVNRQYLDHDYYTDIITFASEEWPIVSGDIFVSTDRVAENAATYGVDFEVELRRVMIHGILHLCGQGDKSETEAQQMREKEDAALAAYIGGRK